MSRIRATIDEIMTTNRECGLIVAMETALHDERYEVGSQYQNSGASFCVCVCGVGRGGGGGGESSRKGTPDALQPLGIPQEAAALRNELRRIKQTQEVQAEGQ